MDDSGVTVIGSNNVDNASKPIIVDDNEPNEKRSPKRNSRSNKSTENWSKLQM